MSTQTPNLFQSTRPVRGATSVTCILAGHHILFQSTRPVRGATKIAPGVKFNFNKFQSTRPVRGATSWKIHWNCCKPFQSTRPVRGATPPLLDRPETWRDFNPRAPCGARPCPRPPSGCRSNFNPRAPCGARPQTQTTWPDRANFNPRAPCGARQGVIVEARPGLYISIHAPRAGRDVQV